MPTTKNNPNYCIHPNAVTITPNINNDPQRIEVNVVSGSRILVSAVLVSYDETLGSYRKWILTGYNTYLNTNSANSIVYIYARLSSNDQTNGLILFSANHYDLHGNIINNSSSEASASGSGSASDPEYYYIELGNLSAPVSNIRTLTFDTGNFDTDEERDQRIDTTLFDFNSTTTPPTITPKYPFTSLTLTTLILAGKLIISIVDTITDSIKDDTDKLPTLKAVTSWIASKISALDSRFLRKDQDDTSTHKLTLGSLKTTGAADIGGDLSTDGTFTAAGAVIHNSTTHNIGTTTNDSTTHNKSTTIIGTHNSSTGTTTGELKSDGANIDYDTVDPSGRGFGINGEGKACLDSLVLRSFLAVPELRYNRITVQSGISWLAPAAGKVKDCWTDPISHDVILLLDLENGEYGSFAANDLCMGIYHFPSGNATADSDNICSQGGMTFTRKGFTTVYFTVIEVYTSSNTIHTLDGTAITPTSNNAYLHISPRSSAYSTLPVAMMSIVGFGNTSDTSRQNSLYATRDYVRFLKGVNSWILSNALALELQNGGKIINHNGGSILITNDSAAQYGWEFTSGHIRHSATGLELTYDGKLKCPDGFSLIVDSNNHSVEDIQQAVETLTDEQFLIHQLSASAPTTDNQPKSQISWNDSTITDLPSTAWTTTALRDEHIGDFLIFSDGVTYKFSKANTGGRMTYYWARSSDIYLNKSITQLNDIAADDKVTDDEKKSIREIVNTMNGQHSDMESRKNALHQLYVQGKITAEKYQMIEDAWDDYHEKYLDLCSSSTGYYTIILNYSGTYSLQGSITRQALLSASSAYANYLESTRTLFSNAELLPTGINAFDRKILVTSDTFEIQNNSGNKTFSVGQHGDIAVMGAINYSWFRLTSTNCQDYYYKNPAIDCGSNLNLKYLPQCVILDPSMEDVKYGPLSTDLLITLPIYLPQIHYITGDYPHWSTEFTYYKDTDNPSNPYRLIDQYDLRSLIGRKFIILNQTSLNISFVTFGCTGNEAPHDVSSEMNIPAGKIMMFECCLYTLPWIEQTSSQYEMIYWKISKGGLIYPDPEPNS